MQRRSAHLVAAIALVCVLFPAAAAGGDPTVVRHPVYGGGEAFFGDCPSDPIPPAGTVCTDNYVLFWKGVTVIGGGSLATTEAPWQIFAATDRVEFDGTGGEPRVTLLRWGSTLLPDHAASSDQVQLTTASVRARVPMSDGSLFDFAASWTAWSDRLVFGNTGPATGRPRHNVDRCLTSVSLGHQKVRFATMTGTLNGEPVHSYTSFDFAATIFDNAFRYIDAPHGGCA